MLLEWKFVDEVVFLPVVRSLAEAHVPQDTIEEKTQMKALLAAW